MSKAELSKEQIEFYSNKGYLIVEDLFTTEEVAMLRNSSAKFEMLTKEKNIIREENGQIRSVFAPHKYENAFDWLYKQSRLVRPAEQLIGADVYLYQFKLNNKQALGGDWWEWHQDFPYWHFDDGVLNPQMISAMVLFQDTEEIQGPLILLPGSQKLGIVDFEPKEDLASKMNSGDVIHSLNANLKYTVKKDLILDLSKKEKIISATGKCGTCIFFHPNIFHASNSNMSPVERNTAILTYNDVKNIPSKGTNRPDYLCSRDYTSIIAQNNELTV